MRRLRILVVDDTPEFLEAATTLLSAHPRAEVVGTARSAAQAIQLIGTLAPDLVIMDVVMPGMDGVAATKRIAGMPSPPEVVVVTFYNSVELQREAMAAGAVAFVSKERLVEEVFPIIDARVSGAFDPLAGV